MLDCTAALFCIAFCIVEHSTFQASAAMVSELNRINSQIENALSLSLKSLLFFLLFSFVNHAASGAGAVNPERFLK